jgi:hypothetical protein
MVCLYIRRKHRAYVRWLVRRTGTEQSLVRVPTTPRHVSSGGLNPSSTSLGDIKLMDRHPEYDHHIHSPSEHFDNTPHLPFSVFL